MREIIHITAEELEMVEEASDDLLLELGIGLGAGILGAAAGVASERYGVTDRIFGMVEGAGKAPFDPIPIHGLKSQSAKGSALVFSSLFDLPA